MLLSAACLAAAARHYQPRLARHLALRSAVNDCVNWRPPAGLPVYDEDPELRTLAAQPGGYVQGLSGVQLRVPPMERLQSLVPLGVGAITPGGRGFDFSPPVFTQTLTVGGERRIVALCLDARIGGGGCIVNYFTGAVVAPGHWYEAPRLSKPATGPADLEMPAEMQPSYKPINLIIPGNGGHLRIDAGSVDPADPTSALYPYTFGDRRGKIRLRLLADETIELSPEDGPLKEALEKLARPPGAGNTLDR